MEKNYKTTCIPHHFLYFISKKILHKFRTIIFGQINLFSPNIYLRPQISNVLQILSDMDYFVTLVCGRIEYIYTTLIKNGGIVKSTTFIAKITTETCREVMWPIKIRLSSHTWRGARYQLCVKINKLDQLPELDNLANAFICVYVIVSTSVWSI